jgi:membrane protein DedA with SNARE-associated domain
MDTSSAVDLVIKYGYVTVFLIVAVENIEFFGSIPTSLIAAALGAAASKGYFDPAAAVTVLTVASITGDVIGYWLGRYFGRPLLERWGGVMLKNGRLEKMEAFFKRFGVWGVFFSRFIFASFQAVVNILSGISRMRFLTFFTAAFLGELLWSVFYFFLGYYFWPKVQVFFSDFLRLGSFSGILIVFGLAIIVYIMVRYRKRIAKIFRK